MADAADDDFEFQLAQEEREREAKAAVKTRVDPTDGTEYEWNEHMKAWFPKIDDNFIAQYQSQYGNFEDNNNADTTATTAGNTSTDHQFTAPAPPLSTDPQSTGDSRKDSKTKSKDKPFVSKLLAKRKEEEPSPEWFDIADEHNTKVYVNNLPEDTTEESFLELMKKCGYVAKDERNEFKVKLYRDSNGQPKGDGLCTYLKRESVDLALNILDGYRVGDRTISVERARFTPKGQYDPSLKPKRRKRDKQKEKKKIEKLLDWRPDKVVTERPKCEKTVVISNMFDPKDFVADAKLILEYRSDLRDECGERCGEVKRVDVYDCHPEGVAAVVFAEFAGADQCVQLMNGRFFAGRRLAAEHWDGRTRYKTDETEEEAAKRIQQWDEYLEREADAAEGGDGGQQQPQVATAGPLPAVPSGAVDSTDD
ncbi:unnamed protein product [Medioppia subpectinata]|uniref:RRM domain-containing protein n=1 Tax=Medioppia subpectinata TaxID=1979941 RepID=A0A7R9L4A9_9ACAR|nr:unnamed protein product [Medioppia subpectinata]CAG2115067.1 unnamed protein product [Medioppia subpectinata]